MVNARFGAIAKSEHEMPEVYTEEPGTIFVLKFVPCSRNLLYLVEQEGERRVILRRTGKNGMIYYSNVRGK